jgi:hypothetical protein
MIAATTVLVVGTRHRQGGPLRASPPPVARLIGEPRDLGAVSRSLLKSTKRIRCFEVLPDGKTARLVLWGNPPEPVDLDLRTGRATPAPLLAATFKSGCPRLSPDGHSLLYTEYSATGPPNIMLSAHPDGADGHMITEGSFPMWLPSGKALVYAFERRRGGVISLPQTRVLFKDTDPLEKQIQDIAVSAAGDRVAFLFLEARRESLVEVYSYPSMSLVTSARLTMSTCCVAFDSRRGSLLVTVFDTRRGVLAELRGFDLHRAGQIDGTNINRAASSDLGLTFFTTSFSRSIIARAEDGTEHSIRYPGVNHLVTPVFSEAGDSLLETLLDDGRAVIALQRWSDRRLQPLTSGPEDGFPSLGPGGNSFVYVNVPSETVMACRLEPGGNADCKPIVTDPLEPRHTVLSPDGRTVAYLTAHGARHRIRVVPFSGGSPLDVGAVASDDCPVVWSSPAGISAYDPQAREWREIDSSTGKETGRRHPVARTAAEPCDDKPEYWRAPTRFDLRKVETTSTEVRIVDR